MIPPGALKRGALAALLALAAHGGALRNGLAWDDRVLIEANDFVRDPANIRRLLSADFWSGRLTVAAGARPLFVASLLADGALWGPSPAGRHLTSLLLHAANAALLPAAALSLGASPPAALAAGLLFAAHPGASEAVQAISFRADLLAGLFVLLGLLSWLAAGRAASPPAAAALAALSAAFLALGLLSKESALALPLLAGAAAFSLPRADRSRHARLALAGLLAALIVAAYFSFRAPRARYFALGDAAQAESVGISQEPSPPPWRAAYSRPRGRALISAAAFLDHISLLVLPHPLAADRMPAIPESWGDARAAGGAAASLLLLAAAALLCARARAAGLALFWVLAGLLPVSGIVPLYNPVAERYLYIPAMGAALAAALAVEALARTSSSRRAAWAALLLPALLLARARARDWRSDATLFARANLPIHAPRALYNRAFAAQEVGDVAAAARDYREVLRRHQESVEALVNLAFLRQGAGDAGEAEALLRRAAALRSPSPLPYHALGRLLLSGGRPAEAEGWLRRAHMLSRSDPRILSDWGAALSAKGAPVVAEWALREAVKTGRPPAAARISLAEVLERQNRLEEAEKELRAAVAMDPLNARAAADLAVLYDRLGRPADALPHIGRAVAAFPKSADYRVNRAIILIRLGRPGEAKQELDAAVALEPGHARAWQELGAVLHALGEAEKAERAYSRAVQADPSLLAAWTNLGGIYLGLGRLEDAERSLGRARDLSPGHPVVLNALGSLRYRQEALEEACVFFRAAREAAQGPYAEAMRAAIETNLAVCDGRLQAARQREAERVQTLRKSSNALLVQAGKFAAEGRPELAEPLYEQALLVDPGHPTAWFLLFAARIRERRLEDAERAAAAAPRDLIWPYTHARRIAQAVIHLNRRRPQDAWRLLQEFRDEKAPLPPLISSLGHTALAGADLQMGKPYGAAGHAQDALAADPNLRHAREMLRLAQEEIARRRSAGASRRRPRAAPGK